MRTDNLTGAILDWHTARAEGVPAADLELRATGTLCVRNTPGTIWDGTVITPLDYSTNWALAGPLLEKHRLDVTWDKNRDWCCNATPCLDLEFGATPLIAICRAVVRAAFGDEVEDLPCA